MRAGLLQAGPLAAAGVLANGASVVLTVALARLLTPHSYGVLNQLTGLYLILSMPGSAVVVAVVRRVTVWHEDGTGHLVRRWAGRVHRQCTLVVLVWAVIVFTSRHGVAVLLNQQSGIGIAAILTAAAFFVLLSLDRGLLQAHRAYRPLAVNLLVEMSIRVVAVVVLVAAGYGPSGAAVGILIGEVVAAAHARWAAVRAWSGGQALRLLDAASWVAAVRPDPRARRAAVGAAHRRARSRGGVGVAVDGGGAAEHRRAGGRPGQPGTQRRLRRGVGHEQGDRLRRHRPRRLPAPRGGHPLAPGRPRVAAAGGGAGAPGHPLGALARGRGGRARQLLLSRVPPCLHVGADALAPLVVAMIMLSVSVILTMYLLAVGRRWVVGVLVGGRARADAGRAVRARVAPGDRVGGRRGPGCGAVRDPVRVRARPQGPGRQGARRDNLTRWVTTRGRSPAAPGAGAHDVAHPRTSRTREERWRCRSPPRPGIRRIHFVAWRDLDDPEAGGSELHAHKIASRWAAAGLDVTFRTSAVPGAPAALTRDGYRVLRQSGRYAVFPGAAWEGLRMGHRAGDALVEIWNGMPFLSPLWYRGPRIVFLHHVHAEMWGMVLPPTLARLGDFAERRFAPRFYRSSRIVTLSESSRDEIVDLLHLHPTG